MNKDKLIINNINKINEIKIKNIQNNINLHHINTNNNHNNNNYKENKIIKIKNEKNKKTHHINKQKSFYYEFPPHPYALLATPQDSPLHLREKMIPVKENKIEEKIKIITPRKNTLFSQLLLPSPKEYVQLELRRRRRYEKNLSNNNNNNDNNNTNDDNDNNIIKSLINDINENRKRSNSEDSFDKRERLRSASDGTYFTSPRRIMYSKFQNNDEYKELPPRIDDYYLVWHPIDPNDKNNHLIHDPNIDATYYDIDINESKKTNNEMIEKLKQDKIDMFKDIHIPFSIILGISFDIWHERIRDEVLGRVIVVTRCKTYTLRDWASWLLLLIQTFFFGILFYFIIGPWTGLMMMIIWVFFYRKKGWYLGAPPTAQAPLVITYSQDQIDELIKLRKIILSNDITAEYYASRWIGNQWLEAILSLLLPSPIYNSKSLRRFLHYFFDFLLPLYAVLQGLGILGPIIINLMRKIAIGMEGDIGLLFVSNILRYKIRFLSSIILWFWSKLLILLNTIPKIPLLSKIPSFIISIRDTIQMVFLFLLSPLTSIASFLYSIFEVVNKLILHYLMPSDYFIVYIRSKFIMLNMILSPFYSLFRSMGVLFKSMGESLKSISLIFLSFFKVATLSTLRGIGIFFSSVTIKPIQITFRAFSNMIKTFTSFFTRFFGLLRWVIIRPPKPPNFFQIIHRFGLKIGDIYRILALRVINYKSQFNNKDHNKMKDKDQNDEIKKDKNIINNIKNENDIEIETILEKDDNNDNILKTPLPMNYWESPPIPKYIKHNNTSPKIEHFLPPSPQIDSKYKKKYDIHDDGIRKRKNLINENIKNIQKKLTYNNELFHQNTNNTNNKNIYEYDDIINSLNNDEDDDDDLDIKIDVNEILKNEEIIFTDTYKKSSEKKNENVNKNNEYKTL